MRRGVDPDSIPRFEIPEQVYMDYDDEPATGACWNCDHMPLPEKPDGNECRYETGGDVAR